ncbi:MAG: UDP-glucose 4-epimerase GalE [Tissierellia bacterium]|nr:UDP-glucose 4-epimerase GalE [Tissierellia bacterium]
MAILIIGGAGYIGSHAVRYFSDKGRDVVVVDSLSTGHREAVDVPFYQLDIRDEKALEEVFLSHDIDGVIHFAANSLVGVSMVEPYEYYHNNVYGMMCLLNVMRRQGVKNLVFSSTAATYGEPIRELILEDDPTEPTNPYGETKLAMEKMMKWFARAYNMKYISLRYFNAAGAQPDGSLGEMHNPETHLIPLVLQVPAGQRDKISIFGDDYPTADGTCIRDYIHVCDLASAHLLALEYLEKGGESDVFNLGNGKGYSVKEVIETARKVTGHPIPAVVEARRPGDPAILVASSDKAKRELGWKPEHENLEEIISDAWRFYNK